MTKRLYKQILLLITFSILCLAVLLKLELLLSFVKIFFSVITPVFLGIGIAFVLNKPFLYLQKFLAKFFKKTPIKKLCLPAILITYFLFFGVVCGIVAFLVPQLGKSLQSLYQNLDGYTHTLQQIIGNLYENLNISVFSGMDFAQTLQKLTNMVQGLAVGFFPQLFKATSAFFDSIINISVGFVLSFYILADKQHLKKQVKLFLLAWLPAKQARRIIKIGKLASTAFSCFISGQFTEIIILTVLCFLGMSVLGFKYALLISIIIGITNIIPIVGPFLGTIPSAFILLMDKPINAIWFVVFIIVLQQIECNFIYPRVVGSHMGLPALWVAVGVVVGGGLFGLWGMVLSLPTASILYALLRDDTKKRLAIKFKKQQTEI